MEISGGFSPFWSTRDGKESLSFILFFIRVKWSLAIDKGRARIEAAGTSSGGCWIGGGGGGAEEVLFRRRRRLWSPGRKHLSGRGLGVGRSIPPSPLPRWHSPDSLVRLPVVGVEFPCRATIVFEPVLPVCKTRYESFSWWHAIPRQTKVH